MGTKSDPKIEERDKDSKREVFPGSRVSVVVLFRFCVWTGTDFEKLL